MEQIWHWPGRSLWLTSDIEVSHCWTKKQENWPHTFKSSDCPWLTASSSDTYHYWRFTAKTIGHIRLVEDLKTFYSTNYENAVNLSMSSVLWNAFVKPGDSIYKIRGYFGVQSACLCECGIRSQTGPSVVQLGWLNEISESNINSSASLMRTMRGNCFSKERHYGSLCGDRMALFTKVIGHRGLETVHHTSLHFALLC